jgi:hypothetical protein
MANVPSHDARFLMAGDVPVMLLAPSDTTSILPPLDLDDDGAVNQADGWKIISRAAFTIVDGGDEHFLVETADRMEETKTWGSRVDAAGYVLVLSIDGWETVEPGDVNDVITREGVRGGAMIHVPPGDDD